MSADDLLHVAIAIAIGVGAAICGYLGYVLVERIIVRWMARREAAAAHQRTARLHAQLEEERAYFDVASTPEMLARQEEYAALVEYFGASADMMDVAWRQGPAAMALHHYIVGILDGRIPDPRLTKPPEKPQ